MAARHLRDMERHYVAHTLPVRQSRAVPTETVGSSTDEPNQAFALAKSPPILETLVVEVDEGAGWIAWDRRESFLYNLGADGRVQISSAQARDYMVQFDDTGRAWILFGDGVYGRRPPGGTNNIRATYRVGGGRAGNVPAGTIIKAITKVPRLAGRAAAIAATLDAGGKVPAVVAVEPDTFVDLHKQFYLLPILDSKEVTTHAGRKVRALKIAAELELGGSVTQAVVTVPAYFEERQRAAAYFENKRMAGTTVRILDPGCVLVDVGLDVLMDAHYQQETVRQGVFGAVTRMLAFANVDFGQTIYQSDVYALIEAVPGVLAVTLTRFRRSDSPLAEIEDELLKANLPPLAQLPVFMQEALRTRKMTEGRIELGPFEIPVLGELEIRLRTAGR